MISIEKDCTGCMACMNCCPVGAITQETDRYGFIMPKIHEDRCIDCGLCQRVCPLGKAEKTEPLRAYAMYHQSRQVVETSSSGGVFYALASLALKENGIVFGCCYNEKEKQACLSDTDHVPLERLLRSKYVESFVGYGFQRVKKELETGRQVVFCATPCQAAGLASYLGRPYENLLIVDFTCGAVTAGKCLRDHLEKLEKKLGAPLSSLNFRDKHYGWGQYCLTADFENGKRYRKTAMSDPYFFCFLRSSMQRFSCHGCRFADSHVSDVVLADFWKYKSFSVDGNDGGSEDPKSRRGISLALAMTQKGLEELKRAGERMHVEEVDKKAASYNLTSRRCPPEKVAEIYEDQRQAAEEGVEALRKRLLSPKRRAYFSVRQWAMDHPKTCGALAAMTGRGQIMDPGNRKSWEYKSLEDIKKALGDPGIKVVSFDVFDTLLKRPLGRPDDLFELLDGTYAGLSSANISFYRIRTQAEGALRRRIGKNEIPGEDISLDDIYRSMEEMGIPSETASAMKQAEWEAERRLLQPRKSGQSLFSYAQALGKRIIAVSDMYLSREQIRILLQENGYQGIEGIFVSSDIGKRKITGNLYLETAQRIGVRPEEIFHIGDNEEADCQIPASLEYKTAWLPKALDVYSSKGCSLQVQKICRDLTDWEAAKRSVGIGIMRGMAANQYFDDPFRPFEASSDYNGDPYFVGYGALGMELLSLILWLSDQLKRDGAKKMIFMARDGYLPMKAYEIYREYHPELPLPAYLRVSRLSLLPAMIRCPEDLFDLPTDLSYQTPEKIRSLLSFCAKTGKKFSGFSEDEPFSRDTFHRFIKAFIKEGYDGEKHKEAVDRIASYLRNNEAAVTEDASLFDLGYSGRLGAAVAQVLGICPNVYYFHTDAREHYRYERRSGIRIRAFFDFNPHMESSLREYSYLEPEASCIGYTEELEPIYDEGPAEGYREAAEAMQRGALDFVRDYMKYFAWCEAEAGFRVHDGAMAFEAFLRHCSVYDRKIYDGVLIDDQLWGGRRDIDLKELMEIRLRKIPDYAKERS